MVWLAPTPRLRHERHYGERVSLCFAERPGSVDAVVTEAVARNATGEALVEGAHRFDYRTLDDLIGRFAGGLARRGIGHGERVALLLENSAEFVVALLATMRLGAIAVPLNVREGPRELAFVLGDCGARALIHHETLAGSLPAPHETPALEHRLSLVGQGGPDAWAHLLAPTAPPVRAARTINEEDVAAILYTSGTTGRPKGAMLTHLGLVHAGMIYENCMGLGASDRSVASVPLSHVTGLTAGIMAMLRVAGTLIVMPAFKAEGFLELAATERMTHTVMVPAMYNLCLMQPGMGTADLSAWRIGGYGGAPMPEVTIHALAERLPRLQLFNAYGSTETTGPVVLMPPSASRGRSAAVGCAVPPASIRIMDDAEREVAPGDSGEIWLAAPNVVPGYWGNAAATAAGFVAGYWRSGDIGRLDETGFLTLLDRAKDLVNRGGFKIYSVEVENVLAAHSDVIEAAVVARPCPVLGERVHAVVVARAGFDDAGALRAHCAASLADYKVPETITFLDQPLPRNANGKVLKKDLRDGLTPATRA